MEVKNLVRLLNDLIDLWRILLFFFDPLFLNLFNTVRCLCFLQGSE